MKDVDAAETLMRRLNRPFQACLADDAGLECHAGTAVLGGERGGLLSGGKIAVDRQHPGAFLGEAQRRRPAVAHSAARPLARADDDRGLARQPHVVLRCIVCLMNLKFTPCPWPATGRPAWRRRRPPASAR